MNRYEIGDRVTDLLGGKGDGTVYMVGRGSYMVNYDNHEYDEYPGQHFEWEDALGVSQENMAPWEAELLQDPNTNTNKSTEYVRMLQAEIDSRRTDLPYVSEGEK